MRTIQAAILDEIVKRLSNIKIANGYPKNVIPKFIQEMVKTPFNDYDLPRIIVYGGVDSRNEAVFGSEYRAFSVNIQYYTSMGEGNFVRMAYELSAAAITAINRSTDFPLVSDSPENTLDELVAAIEIDSISPIIGDAEANQYCGADLTISVRYYASYTGYID